MFGCILNCKRLNILAEWILSITPSGIRGNMKTLIPVRRGKAFDGGGGELK